MCTQIIAWSDNSAVSMFGAVRRVYTRGAALLLHAATGQRPKKKQPAGQKDAQWNSRLVSVGHTDFDAFGDVLPGSSEAAVPFEAATPSETTPVPGYSLGSDASVPTPVCPGLGWPPGGLAILWPVAGDEARTHGGLDKSFAVIL